MCFIDGGSVMAVAFLLNRHFRAALAQRREFGQVATKRLSFSHGDFTWQNRQCPFAFVNIV
jgi:hypothetical protein